MDAIPILTEAEGETSMEQDVEEKIHKRISTNTNLPSATNTLFNITFENFDDDDEKYESVEFKNYESRLQQQMKDWKSVFRKAYTDSKQSKQKHPTVDKSILPIEKLEYLDQAINLQHFIRESLEFRQQATLFLEYDYAEFIEMKQNLEGLHEHKLNLIKANAIAANLANIEN